MSPVLEARGVTKRFGGITAVDNVSFQLEPQGVLGVVGPNGAGKTALLNCLGGVYSLDAGSVHLAGAPIHRLPPHAIAALGVARTFQSTEHLADMTALEYLLTGVTRRQEVLWLEYGLRLPSAIRAERAERARAADALERVGLGQYLGTRLRDMPYGVQKQVDVARVIASGAQVALLDEPTSGTNARDRTDVESTILRLRDQGVAMIIIDHDVGFVRGVCEDLIVMDRGRVIAHGDPGAVLQLPEVQEAYLGVTLNLTPEDPDGDGTDGRAGTASDGQG
jgi:branched-chain amino acid transport system ATP-binding protein